MKVSISFEGENANSDVLYCILSNVIKRLENEDKTDETKDPYYKPQKYVLGFDKGYITIFRGVKEEHEEWFNQSICRWAKYWGWYVISTQEVPKDLPEGIEPVRLYWEPMDNGKEWLKEEKEIVKYVQSILFKKTNSKIQGRKIGKK